MVPARQGYFTMRIVSRETCASPIVFQSRSHNGIAPPPPQFGQRGERIPPVSGQEDHGVEPQVGDLRHEMVAPRLGEHCLDRLLADFPLTGVARLREQAGHVGGAVRGARPLGDRVGQVAQRRTR